MDATAPTEPASVADGELHVLDPRLVPLRRTTGWIAVALVTAGTGSFLLPLLLFGNLAGPAHAVTLATWILLTLSLAVLLQVWPPIGYRYASYRVGQEELEIRRGVLWRRILKVPRSRIQHTEVSQGPLERRYGLATLGVYTAGTDHARVSLPGLEHGLARRIREHLQPRDGADAV